VEANSNKMFAEEEIVRAWVLERKPQS
jgi:hypothetical protein